MATTRRIYRMGEPKQFWYQDGFGSPITDQATLERIEKLVIPPAWKQVEISQHAGAKVQATGYDEAGRKQYLYNPAFRAAQERKKFDRILAFANALPMMREITARHLSRPKLDRQKVLAAMVRLIDLAYFRVGSERYARENHTYGLATMRSRHLKIEDDRLIFHYIGKSHKDQLHEVRDERLAKIVAELDHLPGYEIFKYYDEHGQLVDVKSDDLNAYIKEIMGHDFSAKDFRTWAGTLIAAVALAETGRAASKTETKRNVVTAVKHVAEHLGNTPAIARASYIDPRIIDCYLNGQTIHYYVRRINHFLSTPDYQHFSPEEIAVLKLLHRRLKPSTG